MEIKEKINELERQLNELKASLKEEAKEERPITERVKTFNNALEVLGTEHPFVQQYDAIVYDGVNKDNADIIAYYKLRIITAALNEGWKPQFTEDEYRYFPYYQLYTQAECDNLPDKEKQHLVLFGGDKGFGALCGLAGANSSFAWSGSYASIGSRLVYKTAELAEYSARQFTDIWADFYLIRK